MREQIEFERQFEKALIKLRLILALLNGFLLFITLGRMVIWMDYTVIICYLSITLLSFWIRVESTFLRRTVSFVLVNIDLLGLGYLLMRTGGITSRFFPMMFITIFALAMRYRYWGITFWSLMGSSSLGVAGLIVGQDNFNLWFLKSASLFLMGYCGVFLIRNTYQLKFKTEEIPELQLVKPESTSDKKPAEKEEEKDLTLDEIFSQTLKVIREEKLTTMAALMMFDNRGQLKIYASFGWEEAWLQHYQKHSLTQKSLVLAPILVFKRPLLGVDIQKHSELTEIFREMPVEGFFAFPLNFESEVIGVLVITKPKLKQLLTQEEQKLVEIAGQTSLRLKQMVEDKEKGMKENLDSLTGLYSRAYYDEQLEELIYWAQLREVPLSLLLIALDNFEKYNEAYGTQAGEQLLKKIGLILAEVVGKQGIATRWSGEEFALILWNVDRVNALRYAEIINQKIGKLTYRQEVTVSMGIGNMPQHAKDQITLVEYTHKALTAAKVNGKNRISDSFSA